MKTELDTVMRKLGKRAVECNLMNSRFAESILQSSAVATFVIGTDHKVMFWNKACEELTGTKASEIVGTRNQWKAFYDHPRPCVADLVVDGKVDGMEKRYATYTKSTLIKNGVRAEGWYPNLGGKNRYISFDAAPIYGPQGKMVAAIETLHDITERKRVQEGLEESKKEAENEYLTILENTGTAVMVIEDDMTVSRVNKKFSELTGYSREEFEGKKKWTSLVATKDDLARMKHYHRMRRMGPGIAPKAYRFDLIDKQGNVRSIYNNIDVVPGTKQSIASMLDITERMRARQAVERFHRNQEDTLKKEVEELTALVTQLKKERDACVSALAATPRMKKGSADSKEREKLGKSLHELEATLDTSLTKEIKIIKRGLRQMGKKRAKA